MQKFKKIELPKKITHMASYAIGDCPNIEEIILPNIIEILDNNVIFNCPNLKRVYWGGTLFKSREFLNAAITIKTGKIINFWA